MKDAHIAEYFKLDAAQRVQIEFVHPVLNNLYTIPTDLPTETRRELLSTLISTLSIVPSPNTIPQSTPPSPLLLTTFSIIKLLGRSSAGSEELARENGLRILLSYGGLERVNALDLAVSGATTSLEEIDTEAEKVEDAVEDEARPTTRKDPLLPYESEALRCLCNTLTLHPSSRILFPTLLVENKSWLNGLVALLATDNAGFLAARLLFLLTSTQGDLVAELVEKGDVVRIMTDYAKTYIKTLRTTYAATLSIGPMPTPSDLLQEHLKTIYNLMLQYGRSASSRPLPISDLTSPPQPPSPSAHLSPPSSSTGGIASTASSTNESNRSASPTIQQSSVTEVDIGEKSEDAVESTSSSEIERSESPSLGTTTNSKKKKRFWESSKSPSTTAKSNSPPPAASVALPVPAEGSTKSNRTSAMFSKLFKDTSSPSSTSPSIAAAPYQTSSPVALPPATGETTAALDEGPLSDDLSLFTTQHFLPLFPCLLTLSVLLPPGTDDTDPSRLLRHATDTLLNFPIALEELVGFKGTSWLQQVEGAQSEYDGVAPLVGKLLGLIERACTAFFPITPLPLSTAPSNSNRSEYGGIPHPDDIVAEGIGESARAEEILAPLILLLRKVTLLAEPAKGVRAIIFPDEIDRTNPLSYRPDLTGHLIRLLSSMLLPNTASATGELLYNLCNRDPTLFSTTIGYGSASGVLQNMGELIPPPDIPTPSSPEIPTTTTATRSRSTSPTVTFPSKSATARPINPITGAYESSSTNSSNPNPMNSMTEEEKLLESERLFVLFDRMSRNGVISADNPIKKAKQDGKFDDPFRTREREAAERRKELEEEDEDEREVERDLKKWKESRSSSIFPTTGKRAPKIEEVKKIVVIQEVKEETSTITLADGVTSTTIPTAIPSVIQNMAKDAKSNGIPLAATEIRSGLSSPEIAEDEEVDIKDVLSEEPPLSMNLHSASLSAQSLSLRPEVSREEMEAKLIPIEVDLVEDSNQVGVAI